MPYPRWLALPFIALLLSLPAYFAAMADEPAPLTDEQREEFQAEAIGLMEEAIALNKEGKLAEALAVGERLLAVDRRLVGNIHPSIVMDLTALANMCERLKNFTAAQQHRTQIVAIQTQLFGKEHWQVTDARWALYDVETHAALSSEQRSQLESAIARNRESLQLYAQRKFADAANALEEAADIRKSILGQNHPKYADSVSNLGVMYLKRGDYAQAEAFLRRALEIRRKVLGEKHPEYATSQNTLAGLYVKQGDHARAEPLFREAMETRLTVLGNEHPAYAASLNDLSYLYSEQGDYVRAEELVRQTLEIEKIALGEAHVDYAGGLNNLAQLCITRGDYAKAEPLQRRALEIVGKSLGEEHASYATCLNNLGALYDIQGNYVRAEQCYRQSLEIRKHVQGEDHPEYANSLNNLAGTYASQGNYARAEPLYRQALEIRKKVLSEAHADYAISLNNLAVLYESRGEHTRAELLHRQALEIRKKALGESHPDYAASLNNLAALYQSQGDYAQGEPLYRQALEVSCKNLELAAAIQSERGQLAMAAKMRYTLDAYLGLAIRASDFQPTVYGYVLAWKGMVLARQRAMRAVVGRPELAPVAAELQATTKRLSSIALATPQPEQAEVWRTQIAGLSGKKEELEQRLSAGSAEFRAAIKPITVADLRAALPADGTLVDFLEYSYSEPKTKEEGFGRKWERRIAAFVVVKRGEVQLVDLGLAAPIVEAIDAWRSGFGMDAESRAAGNILRAKLWLPIEKHLAGATTVLISPDGDLGKLPFAALPGKEPGTYLLEDYTLAVVPSARVIVDSAQRSQTAAKAPTSGRVDKPGETEPASTLTTGQGFEGESVESLGNLLVLGGVDYDRRTDADPADVEAPKRIFAARAVRDDADQPFVPLAGTKGELATIDRLYRTTFGGEGIHSLEGSAATQDALAATASQHLYLHLATHGYFASPKYKSALDRTAQDMTRGSEAFVSNQSLAGYHPGLLSGIALAGANQPTEEDDGILTAEEIGSLNLDRCELVVLSACETGLGQAAGGEGLLGVQRAFQAAGAKTVIASLWKVDDNATRDLMERFYENLWSKTKADGQPYTKLEALREAQLWMLKERGPRGIVDAEGKPADAKEKRLPPYFWAAFVLSGDWR